MYASNTALCLLYFVMDRTASFSSAPTAGEPPHIHVQRERSVAKFWLEPVALVTNRGFRAHEMRRITRLVMQPQATLLEAWHDYFGT
jgi:Domain of unknown function (DUF4160)